MRDLCRELRAVRSIRLRAVLQQGQGEPPAGPQSQPAGQPERLRSRSAFCIMAPRPDGGPGTPLSRGENGPVEEKQWAFARIFSQMFSYCDRTLL